MNILGTSGNKFHIPRLMRLCCLIKATRSSLFTDGNVLSAEAHIDARIGDGWTIQKSAGEQPDTFVI